MLNKLKQAIIPNFWKEPEPSQTWTQPFEGIEKVKTLMEYNFIYEIHDGSFSITKQKYTEEEFRKFAEDISIIHWQAISFTGTERILN